MNYSVLPPEINSLRMFSGAGSAPMLEAAVAWDGLSADLEPEHAFSPNTGA
ncbi:putative PPE family protein PPE42 [Mycobacterium simulans]|nr:putative PPE family protein PPE42 [Mycobacterium simulans]